MGWLSGGIGGALAGNALLGPVGAVGGGLAGAGVGNFLGGNTAANNNNIDSIISANQMSRPDMLDPNKVVQSIQPELAEKQAGQTGEGLLSTEAFNPGQSPWMSMAQNNLSQQTQNAAQSGQNSAASSAAAARGTVASHGGLSPAAAERMGRAQMLAGVGANQDSARAGIQGQTQLGEQAGQQAQQAAGQLTSAQQADTGLWGQLANNEQQQKSNISMNNYSQAMQAWAANQAANAQLAAGKKPGGPFADVPLVGGLLDDVSGAF